MHTLRLLHWTLFLGLVATPPLAAEDWPQWLGPRRDNTSTEKVAPWKGLLKVLWRQPVGEGNSSPVVAGGRVFVHAKLKDKNEEEVAAFDAKTGEERWRKSYPRAEFKSLYGNGPRATPAVVSGRLYTFGITGILSCFEAATGEQVWQVDALKQLQASNLFFGMACSPLVEGDHVLINVGGKGKSIVAFDRHKGEVVWKSLDDPASYSSPIAFGQGRDRQVVFLTGANVVSLNPASGEVFWRSPLKDALMESSTTPIHAGDLVMASSITYGSVGLHLEAKDGKPSAKQEWKNAELTSYFSTPVAAGPDHLFLVTGKNPLLVKKPEATLHCVEARTGKSLWQKGDIGKYHASLMRTDAGRLLLLTDSGELALLDPSPKEYRELARSKVSGPETWAHPALSDGRLYVRDKSELLCLQMAP
jgi:outer membrane protein assembly factor BamB